MVLKSSLLIVSSLVLMTHAFPTQGPPLPNPDPNTPTNPDATGQANPDTSTKANQGASAYLSAVQKCIKDAVSFNPDLYGENGSPERRAGYATLVFSCINMEQPPPQAKPGAPGATPPQYSPGAVDEA